MATRPSSPTLAEQCIGRMPRFGSRSFISVKMDFLISPAYSVPPIRISEFVRWRLTKLVARVPSVAGSAVKLGACRIRASGWWRRISSSEGTMNIVCAKSACHALSDTTRTDSCSAGFAPAKESIT